jgi:hypothetical protein
MDKLIHTKTHIQSACQQNVWDFGNAILYKLCKENFKHDTINHIITKVLFIGRIYSAAVERRRNKTSEINDNFYIKTVAPAFRDSLLDEKLSSLQLLKRVNIETTKTVLETHHYLTILLKKITALEKRSFCSKYLHFHLPDLFFIYDSRALNALRLFKIKLPYDLKQILELENIDLEYAKFYCKCVTLKRQIKLDFNIDLTNRQLDNLLIQIANTKNF